ncbi:hypothetical protein LLG95_01250 [bacterium]|nr:hypothetical protein [bacterium]
MKRKTKQQPKQIRRVEPGMDWLVPVVLFAIAVVAYLPALDARFVWDDDLSIGGNTLLRGIGGLWRIWTSIGSISGEMHYWPLTYTVLWAEWQMWGPSPAGYHFVNMLLHGAIVVQVWRLMRRMGLPGAIFGAALFALHPVHVEAVAWVISIKDLLATLLFLVAFECYLNFEDRVTPKWLAIAVGVTIAAMLGKSSPVVLPAALAIWVWYRRGRFNRRDALGIAVIAAVALAMAAVDIYVGSQLNHQHDVVPPLAARINQAGLNFWRYAWKLIFPAGLSLIYPQRSVTPAWLPWIGIGAVTLILWALRRRIGRGPLACWLFYGVALAPIVGIVYFHYLVLSPIADRYQYLASVVPLAAAGAIAARFTSRWEVRRYAAAAALLLVMAGMCWRQAGYFHDNQALFERALKIAPDSAGANMCMGTEALQKKNYGPAEAYLSRALQADPNLWGAVSNLAAGMMQQNRPYEAAVLMQSALKRGCEDPGVLSNLAWLSATQSDPRIYNPKLALELAEKCVRESPRSPVYHNSKAAALAANGRTAEALATAKHALELARARGNRDLARVLESQFIPTYEQGKAVKF